MRIAREDLLQRVAARIALVRRERGITQEGMAASLDIATKNVQRIEGGKQNLTLRTIERIATVLGVKPEHLLAPDDANDSESSQERGALERLREAGYAVRPATTSGRRSPLYLPVMTLRAAAGRFTGEARTVEVLGWVAIDDAPSLPEGAFVAAIEGTSMEPRVPDGALCLFRKPSPGALVGRILLVEGKDDPEMGGPYALKRVGSVSVRDGRRRVVLRSENRAHPPITVDMAGDEELTIIAELVRVLVPAEASPGRPGRAKSTGDRSGRRTK